MNSGNAFWTVNSVPRTFRSKAASKCCSVISPSLRASPLPALANKTSILPFSFPEPPEFIAQGDRVLVVGFAKGRIKATNRTFEDDWVFAITVRNGKVTNIREYIDTQALARASEMDASPGPNPSRPIPHETIRKVNDGGSTKAGNVESSASLQANARITAEAELKAEARTETTKPVVSRFEVSRRARSRNLSSLLRR